MTESLSTRDLIARALRVGDVESEAYWDCVRQLQVRGTREVLEAASLLCQSPEAAERELAADVLAQLGSPERPFAREAVPLLIELLDDITASVCGAAATGL